MYDEVPQYFECLSFSGLHEVLLIGKAYFIHLSLDFVVFREHLCGVIVKTATHVELYIRVPRLLR